MFKNINKVESILYIEDEDFIRDELSLFLEQYCNNLYLAKDGQEGFELYEEKSPDIIISDIMMPRLNGLDMLEKIREKDLKQRVFLVSAYNDTKCLLKAINLQVDAFIIKPLDIKVLLKNLSKSIDSIQTEKNLQEQIEKNKKISFELLKNQEELISQSKFAAMGEMISMIAHQWRQPLNNIMLNVNNINNMVLQKKIIKKDFDHTVTNIEDTIEYMSKTIEDFRDFLKKDDDIQEVRIVDLILKPKLLIETELQKNGIDFQFESHIDTNKTINLESSKFYQVMMNLYKNSIDEFSYNKSIKEPFIKVSIDKSEGLFVFKISDNAGGIPENIIKRVFEPYFSTKSKNGTGLGLYMCKRIINEFFQGDISVENDEKGAIFTVTIQDFDIQKDTLDSLGDECFKWDKENSIFLRDKNCCEKKLLQQSNYIFKALDSFYIKYELDDKLNIRLVLD